MKLLRIFCSKFIRLFIAIFGRKIIDFETGEYLGKALIFVWNGQVYVFGLDSIVTIRFLPNKKLTYLYSKIGFKKNK